MIDLFNYFPFTTTGCNNANDPHNESVFFVHRIPRKPANLQRVLWGDWTYRQKDRLQTKMNFDGKTLIHFIKNSDLPRCMDEEKLMIDAWFFAMIFGNSAVLDKHLDLCWKINAHLNMHDSASFSGFWDDLLSMAASFVALWYKIVPFTGASAFIFPPKKLLTPGQESCETIFWFSVQYYVLQVWSWSPFATSMILSIWIWIETVYKEWENRSRWGFWSNVLWRCVCFS